MAERVLEAMGLNTRSQQISNNHEEISNPLKILFLEKTLNEENTILKLDDIGFRYPAIKGGSSEAVLTSVTMRLHKGEGIAIIGPPAAEKHAAEIIGSLLVPEKGSLYFQDQELSQLTEEARCRFRNQELGFVSKSPFVAAVQRFETPSCPHSLAEPKRTG